MKAPEVILVPINLYDTHWWLMEVDMVADMGVDKVADKVADMVAEIF